VQDEEKRIAVHVGKENKEQMFYLEEDFRDRITWCFSFGFVLFASPTGEFS
jgi:hypothetical protein